MNNKGIAHLGLIIILVILLGTVGYFLVTRNSASEPYAAQTPDPAYTPDPSLTPLPSDDSTVVCQTESYNNNKLGFSIDYYTEWGVPVENYQVTGPSEIDTGELLSVVFGVPSGEATNEEELKRDSMVLKNLRLTYEDTYFTSGSGKKVSVREAFEQNQFNCENYSNCLKQEFLQNSREGIVMTYEYDASLIHGSGIEYSGPYVRKKMESVYTTLKDGTVVSMHYSRAKEGGACGFAPLLQSYSPDN